MKHTVEVVIMLHMCFSNACGDGGGGGEGARVHARDTRYYHSHPCCYCCYLYYVLLCQS